MTYFIIAVLVLLILTPVYFVFILPAKASARLKKFADTLGIPFIEKYNKEVDLPDLQTPTYVGMAIRISDLQQAPVSSEMQSIFGKIRSLIKVDDTFCIFLNFYRRAQMAQITRAHQENQCQLVFLFNTTHVTGKHRIIYNRLNFTKKILGVAYGKIILPEMEKMGTVSGVNTNLNAERYTFLSDNNKELSDKLTQSENTIQEITKILEKGRLAAFNIDYMLATMIIDLREDYGLIRMDYSNTKLLTELYPAIKQLQKDLSK